MATNSPPKPEYLPHKGVFLPVFQIMASLEEQNFTEAWGKKAKQLYGPIFRNFTDLQLKKIIGSIQTLGPSNLPMNKREQVGILLGGV